MTTLDAWCAYTRIPSVTTKAFPEIETIWAPLIDVVLSGQKRSVRASALLDTGASWSLFNVQYAEVLGINWKAAPSFAFSAVGTPGLTGYVVDVELALADERYQWPCKVVFSEAEFSFPILGHIGFFDRFEVRFDTRNRGFRLIRHESTSRT